MVRLEVFRLRSGTKQESRLSPFLFNIILEDEKTKAMQIVKEEVKLSLEVTTALWWHPSLLYSF